MNRKSLISVPQEEKKKTNPIRQKDQLVDLFENKQSKGNIIKDIQISSQSKRTNIPSHNQREISLERSDSKKTEIQDSPILTPSTLKSKVLQQKTKINQVLPQISQQNNFKKQQNKQLVQQQQKNKQNQGFKNLEQQSDHQQNQPQQTHKIHQQQILMQKYNQQQQSKQEQIIYQRQNQNQIRINLKSQESSKQQLIQCINLINSINGKVNVKIKSISRLNQQLLQQLQGILEQYPEQIQHESKIEQDKNEFIIQVERQNDNDVSQQLKTIIFQWKCMKHLQQEADNYNIDIDIDFDIKTCQYKLFCNQGQKQQKSLKKFHRFFEEKLLNFIILTHKCQYQEEAIQKLQILEQDGVKNIFLKVFKIQNLRTIDIDLISNYPQNFTLSQIDRSLKDIVRYYFEENILIISLINYDTNFYGLSIHLLQEKLNEILQKLIIYHLDKTQIFHLDYSLDLDEIRYQIQSINTDRILVQIPNPSKDHVNGKFSYQIIYQTWILRQDYDRINEKLQDLKRKIEQIINPIMYLEIKEQQQIKIWNLYIKPQYDQKQIQVIQENYSIFIKFVSEKQQNIKNKEIILQKISNLKYSKIEFTLDQLTVSILIILKYAKLMRKLLFLKQYIRDIQEDSLVNSYLKTLLIISTSRRLILISIKSLNIKKNLRRNMNKFINVILQQRIIKLLMLL